MMRGKLPNVFAAFTAHAPCAVLLAASLAATAFAQTPARQPRARSTSSPPASQPRERGGQSAEQPPQTGGAGAQADLSITARVTARELRFERVPNPKVEFTGRPRRETLWESERENLPAQVQPGVTYRDIGITLRITSVFADIDRIVAEALGEVPASDDSKPRQAAPPGQPNAPPARQEDNAPPAQQSSRAPQTGVQPADPDSSAPSPAKAHANVRTTTRRGHARGGRGR
jgi:hypothetical protein